MTLVLMMARKKRLRSPGRSGAGGGGGRKQGTKSRRTNRKIRGKIRKNNLGKKL